MASSSESGDPHILVGVDGSPSSIAALNWAARQAELTGVRVSIVTTWEWPSKYQWMPSQAKYDPAGDTQKKIDAIVDEVRSAHPSVSIQSTVIEGQPARVLARESHGAELLVIGCRGHGEFPGMLLGSVSLHCVTGAHCPVVVMRDD